MPQASEVIAEEKPAEIAVTLSDVQINVTPTFIQPTVIPTLLPTAIPTAEVPVDLTPQRVIINSIGISAPVIPEGKTSDGRMDVPPDNATVGWWKYGAYPGEIGSAVLAGHYKMDDGSPGVFYNLSNVNVGDEISIITKDNKEKVFLVTDKVVYPESDFPLDKVFADKNFRSLNFITCSGKYLKATDDYSHRLVIYSKLVKI